MPVVSKQGIARETSFGHSYSGRMDAESLQMHFDSSPAIRLLRAASAPWVAAFLHAQFKRPVAVTRTHTELLVALRSFQESVHTSCPHVLTDRAEHYLNEWSSPDRCWLRRALETDCEEAVYQLTSASEEVLRFLEQSQQRELGFIGTESRLRLIVDSLRQVVVGASDDSDMRVSDLKLQKAAIEQQIRAIEQGEDASRFSDTRIREQFGMSVSLLSELQRDFRAVEERFRQITATVQQQLMAAGESRGGILEQALDAEDSLREDDQGVSFYEFFRLIQSADRQSQLRELIRSLEQLEQLADQQDGLQTVRQMLPVLLTEAARVTETERRLSATIRRLLDPGNQKQGQRISQVLQEIKTLAAGQAQNPPTDRVSLSVDDSVRVYSPVGRRFWSPPMTFETIDLTSAGTDSLPGGEGLAEFSRLSRIDFRRIRSNVEEAVSERGMITLDELLELHPPTTGVMEVLGYMQLASEGPHLIDGGLPEDVVIPGAMEQTGMLVVRIPRVVFVSEEMAIS